MFKNTTFKSNFDDNKINTCTKETKADPCSYEHKFTYEIAKLSLLAHHTDIMRSDSNNAQVLNSSGFHTQLPKLCSKLQGPFFTLALIIVLLCQKDMI